MTADELAAANLLATPSARLDASPGVVYFLVFEKSIGPLTDNAVVSWVEDGQQVGVLPPIAYVDSAVGIAVKAKTGTPITVQSALIPLKGAPSFALADLTLKYVVRSTNVRDLANVTALAATTNDLKDGPFGIEKFLRDLEAKLGEAGKWIIIVLILVLAIVLVLKFAK